MHSVLVFAEGTTTAQKELLPLKPGMFHEAKSLKLPIQLICVEYKEPADAWTNQGTLEHFMNRFSRLKTEVLISYKHEMIDTKMYDVDTILSQSDAWLRQEMINMLNK